MSASTPRLFAIIPAAGKSRRMGRPKLLLPWGTGTVISAVLSLLKREEFAATIVVVRPVDAELREAVTVAGATPLVPVHEPPEMRDSVELALRFIEETFHPQPDDGWVLSPADHPLLETTVLDALLDRWKASPCRILVPTHDGMRGHPVFFAWPLADEVLALPEDQGVNQLLHRHAADVVELPVARPGILMDLDTPDDYENLLGRAD